MHYGCSGFNTEATEISVSFKVLRSDEDGGGDAFLFMLCYGGGGNEDAACDPDCLVPVLLFHAGGLFL